MPDLNQFFDQVKRGDLASIQAAISEDPSLLEATNPSGQSAFLLAMYYRRQDVASYLLSQNPKLDLFEACVAGRTADVLAELDRDPSRLESHSTDGWTPLHLAAYFGRAELATALLDRGADVNALSTNGQRNGPLHAAAAGGHCDLVALLIARGANVNAIQEGGFTALHSAAQSGNVEMTKVLLANGADPSIRAANNQLALDLALAKGHAGLAVLLEAPASAAANP